MATAAQRLVEAETALHAILTGRGIQSAVDSDGSRVQYSTANVSRLRSYIEDLKREIAGTTRSTGPIRPVFL